MRTIGYLLLFIYSAAAAQDRTMDSLRAGMKAAEDTTRIKMTNELAWRFVMAGMGDSAFRYASLALQLAKKAGFEKGEGRAYNTMGVVENDKGNFSEALRLHLLSLDIRKKLGNEPDIASTSNNIGNDYVGLGNYTEALRYHLNTLKIREKYKDYKNISGTYVNLGDTYDKMGNLEAALKSHNASLAALAKLEHSDGKEFNGHRAAIYNNLGSTYLKLKNPREALKYHTMSRKLRMEENDQNGIASSCLNIATVYCFEKNFSLALSNFNIALNIFRTIGDANAEAIALLNIGEAYAAMNKYKEAKSDFLMALAIARSHSQMLTMREAYISLSQLSFHAGDHKSALQYYKSFIAVRDSISNEENTKTTVRLEMNYEFEKKEAASRLEQEKKEAVTAAESKKQKTIIYSICGILALVLAFAVFAYRSYLQKKKTNEAITRQKEIIEEKQKEILDSIRYAQKIQKALITSEKYISKNLDRLTKKV
ncbi:MAG: tetratricopeptide repeat protein [Bacteroidia bacterium]